MEKKNYILNILGFLIISFFKISLIKPSVSCLQFFCKDETPFDIFLEKSLAFKSVDYTSCELCRFPVRNEVNNSSHEDLIIAAAVSHIANENFFSRTIRTTGSKCHIVIVCDEEAMNKLPKERYESAVSCGVQFCVVPSKRWGGGYWGKATVAYYYVLAYILRNRGLFKRIIFQDLYDSIFQGDPFTSDLISSPNEIHVTTEFIPNNKSIQMVKYYKDANITVPESYLKKDYRNSSHFGGLADTILRFLLLYISINDFGHSWNDQVTQNYIEFSGALKEHGFSYSDDYQLQRFINFYAQKPIQGKRIGYIKALFGNNSYAVSLHHIYSRTSIMVNLAEVCPIKERNETLVNDYFGKCKYKCIKAIMKYYHSLDNRTIQV